MDKKTNLKSNVILVTGAANGIGAAVAKAFAAQGATLVLLDKNISALEQVYDHIVELNGPIPAIYPLDLKGATADDYKQLVDSLRTNFDRLDGLVHCAASLGQLAPIEHQDTKTWLETLHVNLTGPYLLTQACIPLLKQSQHASIIFTTDNHKDNAYWSAYGIAKSATEGLMLQLADEFEAEGKVSVNCIDPGQVKTELFSRAFPGINPSSLAKPDDCIAPYIKLMQQTTSLISGQTLTL
jgi:NAD(P)-dependent dehydrogenase (short-subunit alcohol dehydrogenase family)